MSTGPMVALHDARSIAEARAMVDLLEAHAIPALVNLELEGILFPWQEPPKSGRARVLVPSTMLGDARDVLRRAGSTGARSPAGATVIRLVPSRTAAAQARLPMLEDAAPPRSFEIPPRAFQRDEDEDEDEAAPIEAPLPEPSPLAPRITIAMFAIALGVALQRALEAGWGTDAVLRFAARAPLAAEPWRLVTAGFIHLGPEHLLSNAAFGALAGVVLFGTHYVGATALVWLVASALGLLTESALATTAVVAGASAGNYGLAGLWMQGQLQRARVATLPRREWLRTLGIVLLLVPGALSPVTSTGGRVAIFAHAAGFAAGAVLGFVFPRRLTPARLPSLRRRARAAFALALALVVLGLGAAVYVNLPLPATP